MTKDILVNNHPQTMPQVGLLTFSTSPTISQWAPTQNSQYSKTQGKLRSNVQNRTHQFTSYWFWFRNACQIPPQCADTCNTYKEPAGGGWGILNKGGEFIGQNFQWLMESFSIKDVCSTSKKIQSNAICKRMHQTINNVLRTLVHTNPPCHTT